MKNLLCIVGPTATGKTKLAEGIKKNIEHRTENSGKAELISVDSRQVYVGMDIGTGKDAKIFGTDLVKPEKLFNVSDFVKQVRPKIEELWKEKKLPILVGGTGLYLKAVVDGIETIDIPPNEELRKRLEKYSVEELQKELRKLDSRLHGHDSEVEKINNSDWNNPRRLIRKIELIRFYEKFQAQNSKFQINLKLPIDKLLIIGLTAPLPQIEKNIELRVKSRLDQGLLEEIKKLVEIYGWNEVLRNTIAYKEWQGFFEGKITKEEAIKNWTKDEIDYAKRQMTWFGKDTRVVWITDDYLKSSLKVINSSNLLD